MNTAPAPRVGVRSTILLGAAGGAAFWVVNLAISLTPLGAEYRAALSIPYLPMLLEALAGGLLIGLLVAYVLQRFSDRIPSMSPLLKAIALSGAAVVAAAVLIPGPDPRSALLGLLINTLRIVALGATIGVLHTRRAARGQN